MSEEIKLKERKPTFDYILNDLAFDSLKTRVLYGIFDNQERFDFEYQIKLIQEELSKLRNQLQQKENIIKEVREYIESNKIYTNEKQEAYTLKNTWYGLELLGILDKEVN